MRRRSSPRSTPIVLAGVVALVLSLSLSCGDIDAEELVCEEAIARLETCCPLIDPRRLNCVKQQGCNSNLTPIFTDRASTCLSDTGCADLMARGICDGLRQLSFTPPGFQVQSAFETEACR